MPEDQQRRVLREAPKLRVGDTVDVVIERLGPPFRDSVSYGPKGASVQRRHRHLVYYFARRDLDVVNLYDPAVEVFLDEQDRVEAIASEVAGIPDANSQLR